MKDALRKQIASDDRFFFNAFQNAAMGMALAEPDGQWLMVNRSLCELTGYSEEEFYKTTFQELIHPGNRKKELDYINSLLCGELESCQKEKRVFHKDGRKIYIQISVSLVKEKDGSPLFFIFQMQDITERKLLEEELVKQATIDMLTGINNRRHFFYLAERDILRCSRYKEPLVLLMIDIDHFKKVNDTYGHSIGDDALKKMVEVCRSEIRAFDNFGRIGGEEFGMLLTKADAKSGFHLAERLRKLVEQSVLITDRGVVKFTISIGGIAFSGNNVSLGTLMKQADEALYRAKKRVETKPLSWMV